MAYFYNKRYKVVSVNSYQRVMSDRLRIEYTTEDAIKRNYLYFRNNFIVPDGQITVTPIAKIVEADYTGTPTSFLRKGESYGIYCS